MKDTSARSTTRLVCSASIRATSSSRSIGAVYTSTSPETCTTVRSPPGRLVTDTSTPASSIVIVPPPANHARTRPIQPNPDRVGVVVRAGTSSPSIAGLPGGRSGGVADLYDDVVLDTHGREVLPQAYQDLGGHHRAVGKGPDLQVDAGVQGKAQAGESLVRAGADAGHSAVQGGRSLDLQDHPVGQREDRREVLRVRAGGVQADRQTQRAHLLHRVGKPVLPGRLATGEDDAVQAAARPADHIADLMPCHGARHERVAQLGGLARDAAPRAALQQDRQNGPARPVIALDRCPARDLQRVGRPHHVRRDGVQRRRCHGWSPREQRTRVPRASSLIIPLVAAVGPTSLALRGRPSTGRAGCVAGRSRRAGCRAGSRAGAELAAERATDPAGRDTCRCEDREVADDALLDVLLAGGRRQDRVTHVEHLPPRAAEHSDWPRWADPDIVAGYRALGVQRPWVHQVTAADAAWSGRHTVLATSTGSGMSLAFWLPALSAVRADRAAGEPTDIGAAEASAAGASAGGAAPFRRATTLY